MAHPNEDMMRKLYDAFNKGDFEMVTSSFAPDIVGHVPGKSQLSGDYKGAEEVMGMFAKLAEVVGGNYSVEVHDVLANDEHAVVLGKINAEKNGERYTSNSVEVYHLKDGKITEFWTLEEDLYASDAFYG